MVAQQPVLNTVVGELREVRQRLGRAPGQPMELRFSRAQLAEARSAFGDMIREGERQLHELCEFLCAELLGPVEMRSVVIGEVQATGERFTMAMDIDSAQLYSTTDLDLGRRQIERLQFQSAEGWSSAELVSNVVEYLALAQNRFQIYRIQSRIKAEEEIWNKVCDEIFEFDQIVLRDKKLRHLSRYIKDVFGVKIVVDSAAAAHAVQAHLTGLNLNTGEALQFVEVKDYLARKSRKHSGWTALKSVVRWGGRTCEIQIQPLHNYLAERELLTRESHTAFKANRDQVRKDVADQDPLFGFYLKLVRWLFMAPDDPQPEYDGVRIILSP